MALPTTRTVPIGIALGIALALVGGAYVLSGPSPFAAPVNAESSAELLAAYAAKDTDQDNLPDWAEVLYGTDPKNPESVKAGVKDGDAVSQGLVTPKARSAATSAESSDASLTLTDRFSQTLLAQYLTTRGATPPTPEELADFIQKSFLDLESTRTASDTFSQSQLPKSTETGAAALRAYAAQIDGILARDGSVTKKTDLEYLSDALENDDADALAKLSTRGRAHIAVANDLMKLAPPTEARTAHLALANAHMRMGQVIGDMGALSTDPLRAFLGMSLYQENGLAFVEALADMQAVFEAKGVTIPEGESGASFAKAIRNAKDALAQ